MDLVLSQKFIIESDHDLIYKFLAYRLPLGTLLDNALGDPDALPISIYECYRRDTCKLSHYMLTNDERRRIIKHFDIIGNKSYKRLREKGARFSYNVLTDKWTLIE